MNARWDYAVIRKHNGKPVMLRFLPYLETPDGRPAEVTIGYQNPHRGLGWGRWEEFFATRGEAQERMRYLIEACAIEDAEIYEARGPGLAGKALVDEWRAEEA